MRKQLTVPGLYGSDRTQRVGSSITSASYDFVTVPPYLSVNTSDRLEPLRMPGMRAGPLPRGIQESRADPLLRAVA